MLSYEPSVRSHGTLVMSMVNLSKSWYQKVPLSRSWQFMIHGTLDMEDIDNITMVCIPCIHCQRVQETT